MRVGIVGTHWGRVHCGTFRRAGARVEALVGVDPEASRRAAQAEGVPRWDEAALEEVDIVVIAVPTALHAALLARHRRPWVLCEKPLFGAPPDDTLAALAASPRLHVNYAFAFLDAARALAAAQEEVGARRHRLRITVDLPALTSARQALLEVGCHPLSFLLRQVGPATFVEGELGPATATFALERGDARVDVHLTLGGPAGFRFDFESTGPGGTVGLAGGYALGAAWSFEPLRKACVAVGEGSSGAGRDLWYEANVAAVQAFVDVARGASSREGAWARGLFDGARALWVEEALAPLLRRSLPAPGDARR